MKKIKLGLILGLMFIMMFIITMIPTQANTPVTGNYELLDGVTLQYNGGGNDAIFNAQWASGFLFFEDGYGYLDYDGAGTLGNGLLPSGDYYLESTNSRYTTFEIGPLVFDIYQYSYEFEFVKSTTSITIYMVYTLDPLWNNDFVLAFGLDQQDYMNIRIRDNDFTGAYDKGYNDGYDNGFNTAEQQYGYLSDGNFLDALTYGNQRYNEGLSQGPQDALAIRNMIPGILGVMIAFFFQIASISVLGISVLDILALTLGITVTVFLIRVFLNR